MQLTDATDALSLTCQMIDIPSVSGEEGFCLFFCQESAVEVFIWSFTYIFDKIVIEIRKVEEKK